MIGAPRRADLDPLPSETAEAGAKAAEEGRIRRIVQFADSLAERGEVDALVAPLRPLLRELRPPRPLSVTRLMFMPLDPLIVHPRRWQATASGIPRTALTQLAEAATLALGASGDAVARMVDGHVSTEADVMLAAGDVLWPAAAAALATCPPPRRWARATGLRPEDFPTIVRQVAALLAHGPTLMRLAGPDGDRATQATAEACLLSAAAAGEDVLAMMLALLLSVWPDPGALVPLAETLADRLGPGAGSGLDRAVDFVLDAVPDAATSPGADMPDGKAVRRIAMLVAALHDRPPPRAARVRQVAQRLDDLCRETFDSTVRAMLAPEPGAAAPPDEARLTAIEAAATELRRIAAVGRRVGAPEFYDGALRRSARLLAATAGLAAADRQRMTAILLGPDAAAPLAAPPPTGRRS
jgi:hypothetical protein